MPKVAAIPVGHDASLVAGYSDRCQALVAKRNQLGLAATEQVYNSPGANISGNTNVIPTAWPQLNVLVGSSGSVLILGNATFTTYDTNADTYLIFFVDGVPNGSTLSAFDFVTGLTAGWHTFNLGVFCFAGANNSVLTDPWMMVKPL